MISHLLESIKKSVGNSKKKSRSFSKQIQTRNCLKTRNEKKKKKKKKKKKNCWYFDHKHIEYKSKGDEKLPIRTYLGNIAGKPIIYGE